ncbi:hypothetical protein BDN71DRAFT_1363453, partial [Pleurotus eryngii]
MTPYEAAFGKKPDLTDLRVWGELVYVRTEGGDKLGGHVKEGHWVGFDDLSKGHRIYWPDRHAVTTERNIYFDNTPDGQISVMTPTISSSPSNTSQDLPASPQHATPIDPNPALSTPVIPPAEDPPAKRARKPSRIVQDLLEGRGRTSNRPSDPLVAKGVRVPEPSDPNPGGLMLEGEGMADWMMMVDEELALAAQMADTEGLEPRNLEEARRRPDW